MINIKLPIAVLLRFASRFHMKYLIVLSLLFLLKHTVARAQEEPIDRWDNWFLVGNKVVFGGDKNFRQSHELQWRVNENARALKEWFYEYVFVYTPNAKWELVPDFRASIKPNVTDFRIGIGAVRKSLFKNNEGKFNQQLVQQAKYQLDYDSDGKLRHGIRYVITYNYVFSEKLIVSGLVGPFYRWSEKFTGIEFVRGGPVFTYVFDKQHTLAVAPLFGAGNIEPNGWAYSFTPMVSLIIRVNKDYKYVPAKYINF